VIVAALTTILGPGASAEGSLRPPPNIVVVLTDDQRWDTLRYMPNVRRLLVRRGMAFQNSFVSNPLCCPARASLLTGNYSHTTGVYTNGLPDGGWKRFHNNGDETSTVATWLHDAGYRTALIGKYMNGYGPDNRYVPPGWDRWVAFAERNGDYYDYRMNVDRRFLRFGHDRRDYSTDVLRRYSIRTVSRTPPDQPLFLYMAPYAPHGPSTPAHRDVGTGPGGPPSWPRNFDERAIRDKPRYLWSQPRFQHAQEAARWNAMVESLQAVDDAVRGIVLALQQAGRLHNTLFVFTSDNGLAFGEHRWGYKLVPYEESIRVPLVIRWDGVVRPGSVDGHLVLNLDLAPTFGDASGAATPATEGGSLLPLLMRTAPSWRSSFLLEHEWYLRSGKPNPPTYCGVRTRSRVFIRYATGFTEYYNVDRDPYQLRNIARDPAAAHWVQRLENVTRQLCQPRPPAMPPF
jgi:N-acetylglucosamine-6-sulfatase